MQRVFVGTLIVGIVLAIFSERSFVACMLAGAIATLLVILLGPRSIAEKVGALLMAAAIEWLAGPRAAAGQSLFGFMLVWTIAATALSVYLHPRAE
jgi:hypothetical protein